MTTTSMTNDKNNRSQTLQHVLGLGREPDWCANIGSVFEESDSPVVARGNAVEEESSKEGFVEVR
jgi:hypothetical protein